jgi:predicted alpha-1,2-mannosidase
LFDALPGGSFIRVLPQQNRILGYVKNHSGNVPKGFACYFVAEFDKGFLSYSTWNNNTINALRREIQTDGHGGVALRFATMRNESIEVKIATSFISVKQAILNFNREVAPYNFDQIRIRAHQEWNDHLNRIQIEGASVDQRYTFYTALYRALLYPRIFYEYDESGKMVHYSPYDTQVHEGYMYADVGFWDTFRALFPLYTIMYPDRHASLMQWLVNAYKEGGWLPIWPSPGYRKVMIGSHAASIFTDAYMKGITNFDAELAYEAMKKDAIVIPPKYAPGRDGLKAYNDMGYLPYPDYKEATSKTLEYAYDDFCIMTMAQKLGQIDDIELYRSKAYNYKNVFDPTINLMRGRRADGSWYEPFDAIEWGGPFTEGNAWHYTWSVFQDVGGLIKLMGGEKEFVNKVDSVFLKPGEFKVGTYGRVVHEMTEMVLGDMGQYAHGNQPVQHLPYLYAYAGHPWKTQEKVREIMNRLYSPDPDGLPGDEDNGAMSAWYIFSALGFYPVCPGVPQYVLGAPLFRKTTLLLQNGNKFVIEAPENTTENLYVESVELNGRGLSRSWITHNEIIEGGRLYLEMNNKPNKKRGTEQEDYPFSMSTGKE